MRAAVTAVALFGLIAFACSSSSAEDEDHDAVAGGELAPPYDAGLVSPEGGVPATSGDSGSVVPQLVPYRLMGRWDLSDPTKPIGANAGLRIAVRFRGPSLRLSLEDTPRNGGDWVAIRVDGDDRPAVALEAGVHDLSIEALGDGEHIAVVLKRTEASVGVVRLHGVSAPGGEILDTSGPTPRTIEFVGDSNTVGYGNEGAGPNCAFTPATENHDKSFAAVAARALQADWSAVAVSGRGLTKNYDGTTDGIMPVAYDRIDPFVATSVWTAAEPPDAIVVMLGQNDILGGGLDAPTFTNAATAFFTKLRGLHPSAQIVVVLTPAVRDDVGTPRTFLRDAFTSAVNTRKGAGDTKIVFFEPAVATNPELAGCDYHLTVAAHARLAGELGTFLAPLL